MDSGVTTSTQLGLRINESLSTQGRVCGLLRLLVIRLYLPSLCSVTAGRARSPARHQNHVREPRSRQVWALIPELEISFVKEIFLVSGYIGLDRRVESTRTVQIPFLVRVSRTSCYVCCDTLTWERQNLGQRIIPQRRLTMMTMQKSNIPSLASTKEKIISCIEWENTSGMCKQFIQGLQLGDNKPLRNLIMSFEIGASEAAYDRGV